MTILADWIAATLDHLDGQGSEEGNLLAAPYVAGSGTITLVNALGNVGPGAVLSVGTNTMLVTAVNALTKQATVTAGYRGSVDANAGTGTLVLVNPRFTYFQIYRAINDTLRQMSSPQNGLFQVAQTTLSANGSVEGYDLTGVTGMLRALEVRRETFGPSLAWPAVPTSMWDVLFTAPGDFASGSSLRVRGVQSGLSVQLVYAKEFTTIAAAMTTDVTTTGVPTVMEDIPPLGAAIRVMAGREVPRNRTDAQGDTRRANEVPPGAVAASPRNLVALWQQRTKEESTRLRQRYPISW